MTYIYQPEPKLQSCTSGQIYSAILEGDMRHVYENHMSQKCTYINSGAQLNTMSTTSMGNTNLCKTAFITVQQLQCQPASESFLSCLCSSDTGKTAKKKVM